MADERKKSTIMKNYEGYALKQIQQLVDTAADEYERTLEKYGEDSRFTWRSEARLKDWNRALEAVERATKR